MATNRRFVRNIFSGQVEERIDDPAAEFAQINQECFEKSVKAGRQYSGSTKRRGGAYDLPWQSEAIGVPLAQMEAFNEASRRHGTGARYVPNKKGTFAVCECDTKRSRAREMKLRGVYDKDAGYGDYAGSF